MKTPRKIAVSNGSSMPTYTNTKKTVLGGTTELKCNNTRRSPANPDVSQSYTVKVETVLKAE